MSIGRRTFLRVFGMSAVSAPVAANAAAQQLMQAEMAALTTLAGHSRSPLSVGGHSGMESQAPMSGTTQGESPYVGMSDYLKLFGKLPSHIEHDVRERTKSVYHLDPDIANKRSWSLSVKILTQAQRNYERDVERYRMLGSYEKAQNAFEKLAGFRWQW